MSYDALFSPIKIRGLELKNRVVLPGMNTKMAKNKTDIEQDMCTYHAKRAAGGCGLNIMEIASICPEVTTPAYMGLWTEHQSEQLKKVTDAVHAAGGKIAVQIWHGGMVPQAFFDKSNKLETPDTLTIDRIHEIIKQFGESTRLAVAAGFDALEFHAGHTYLPHEFMNPHLNKRKDEYGNETLENRARFSLEVIREMRANMPEDMPLFMRWNAVDEMMPKVTTVDETVQVLKWAHEAGVDVVDLSRGNVLSLASVYEVPPFQLEPGFNMENIYKIKQQLDFPVMGVGRVNDPAVADKLIADGKIDLVGVGRGQIADPDWCNKAMAGHPELIRKCIGCDQGCYDKCSDAKATHITCTRNPAVCFEHEPLLPTDAPKNVMVIGGGIAGMRVAQFLKERGHVPTIYEASDELGGRFLLAGLAPKKGEFAASARWEAKECERMGIDIKMGVTVTPEMIEEIKPDYVVVAIGGEYVAPAIPGIDGADIYSCDDILTGKAEAKGEVVIIGGNHQGLETAQFLVGKGIKDVRVMDAKKVGAPLGMARSMYMDLDYPGDTIKKSNSSKLVSIEDHTINYQFTDRKTKKVSDKTRHFDTLIIANATEPRCSCKITAKCEELNIPYEVIGDAKKVRMSLDAAADALAAAKKV